MVIVSKKTGGAVGDRLGFVRMELNALGGVVPTCMSMWKYN